MIIINKKTSELIPYEKNNKTHPAKQIDAIASSLKRFGFKQPLVIDSNNVLVV
jgi:ParB-like chromosome segregation protein Spo0J